MRKVLLFSCILALLLIGCKGQNEPAQVQAVTFRIASFSQTTQPLKAPAATILDDEDGTALTDLYIFDGTTELAHQTSDQDDFGTVTLNLTHGNHALSFVATRSTGLSYAEGVLSCSALRPTFGQLLPLNVTNATPAQDVTLDRLSGQLVITILDAFPAAANRIEFVINPRYTSLNVANLQGTNGNEFTQAASCTSKVGLTNQSYSFNMLCPSLTAEYTADVTINIYNAASAVIYSVTIDDVRLAANTKTLLSGNLFSGQSATVTVNHTWNTDIVGSF